MTNEVYKLLTTEQKILLVANYEADKIEKVRQLMEEEAIGYQIWLTLHNWEISTKHPEKWYCADELPYVYRTYKEVYGIYQQSKQSK